MATMKVLTVVLGFFVVMLDTTIVNVALPTMADTLDAGVRELQWVVDAYTLVFAALLLTAGSLCDRLGARRVYATGLALFGLLSVVCALAPSAPVLIGARALQGIGAAAVVPGSLALLGRLFPDPAERTRVTGLWGGAGGVAAACGPVLGGVLISAVGWQAVFWVNVPVIALGLWLVLRTGPDNPAGDHKTDLPGQTTAITALAVTTFAVIERRWWLLVPGVLLLIAFLMAERRSDHAMLPPALFRRAAFTTPVVVGFALNVSFFGQLFVLSLYFQDYLHDNALTAGLALAPQACSAVVASPLGGRTAARIGATPTMLIGLLVGAVGFGSLVILDHGTPYPLVAVLSFTAGFGMAFAMPAATAAAVGAAPDGFSGIAGGVVNAARQTGSIVGVAVLGGMVGSGEGTGFIDGFHLAVALASGVFLVAAVPVALRLLHHRHAPHRLDN